MTHARKVSEAGLDFIARHEGTRTEAYRDPAGYWTIGIGHLLTKDELHSGKLEIGEQVFRWREGITQAQAQTLLREDLAIAEDCVYTQLGTKRAWYLSQNRFDALVSLVFNIGCRAFQRSTLLRTLREGDYDGVPAQIKRWVYAGNVKLPGLIRRRAEEAELWAMSNGQVTCPRCQHSWTA